MVGATVGRYRLDAKIGAGGMGDVFHAVDPATSAVVAIKVLNAIAGADAQRFVTEARAVNRVPHDGVVKVIEVAYMDGGRPYLVMELLEGKSLEAAIIREERPPLALVDQMLAIVAAAHSVGIVHRDLKPGNIWLSTNGRVRVLDFGVAKLLDENAGVTRTGAMVGTPAYMSPEQVRGTPVDARADLYAIGVMTYELATGKRPYDAPSAFAVAQKHVQAPIPRLPAGSHPAAQPFIDRALAKEPSDRFASADDMRAALAVWLGRSSSPSISVQRPMFTSRAWFAIGAATMVSIGLVVAAMMSRPSKSVESTAGATPFAQDAAAAPRVADAPTAASDAGHFDAAAAPPEDNEPDPAERRLSALLERAAKENEKPMRGKATATSTKNRERVLAALRELKKSKKSGSALDAERMPLERDIDTWGTTKEKGYTRGASPTALADLPDPLSTASFHAPSPTRNINDVPGFRHYQRSIDSVTPAINRPLAGKLTSERLVYRARMPERIAKLVPADASASEDWAQTDRELTKIDAEIATWGTPQEPGYIPAQPGDQTDLRPRN
ncbi:hypothetical protein BH11MYX2_BH11MYX2_38480 [soil metagenome]